MESVKDHVIIVPTSRDPMCPDVLGPYTADQADEVYSILLASGIGDNVSPDMTVKVISLTTLAVLLPERAYDKKAPSKLRTCRDVLEAKSITIVPVGNSEFIAYKPTKDGAVDMDFDLAGALEELQFFDYEGIALGRGCYVMGDVNSLV